MEKSHHNIKKDIQDLIQSNQICVVYDANIYLNLYEYSPEVTTFFVELSELILDKLVLPETVKREFDRNHSTCLNRQRKKFENVSSVLNKPLDQMKDKINKQFDILKGYKFPDIEELEEKVQEQIEAVENAFEEYALEHDTLDEINNRFLDEDKIKQLIDKIVLAENMLEAFSLDEIYLLCSEGEKRYKKNIPPGYKDGRTKTGVQAYGDFLIWKEIIRYCKENKLNLIFVTDDVKEDWYELNNSERIGFRKELVAEFENQTSMNMVGVTSNEIFAALADMYSQEIPTTVEWILGYDVDNYIDQIVDWGIIEDVVGELINSGDQFVDTSTLADYDGSEFEIQDELISEKLVSYEFDGYYDGEAEYILVFNIEIEAYSQQYWGRDDETKEVILSEPRTHILKGEISVKVTRRIESYLDDLVNDHSYANIEIIDGNLEEESSYTGSDLCVECGKRLGDYQNYYGEPICKECMVTDESGEICPMCGRKVPYEFMGGMGFCSECEREYDL